MNNLKFEELINLYFDREISDAELKCLKEELATKVERRREFRARYQLHRATCSALFSENATTSDPSVSTNQTNYRRNYTPSMSMLSGLGIAACFLVVFAASTLVMREPANDMDTASMKTSDLPDEAQYLENKESELSLPASLSSQLRLAGLTPDIVPSNQQLSAVDTEAFRQREAHLQDVINKVNHYRTSYTEIPELQLTESSERTYEESSYNDWPAGFKSSLASFR